MPMKQIFFLTFLIFFTACSFINPFATSQNYIQIQPSTPIKSNAMYKATMRPYTIRGKKYYPRSVNISDTFKGTASWYGDNFHGKLTSNGEYYNMYDNTAAHKTLPMNTIVRVTNLRNNLSTTVRINDRGPFVGSRIIDLSYKAAQDIEMIKSGTAPVNLRVISFDKNSNKYAKNYPKKIQKIAKTKNLNFAIQIASFTYKDKALALKLKYYNNRIYKTFINSKTVNNQIIYRVMVGNFKTLKEAQEFKKQTQYNDAFVVRI